MLNWSRSVILKIMEGVAVGGGLVMKIKQPLPPPVVVILGSTATGKSKLAIDLAKKYGGEVISADSMQVYKELDILTNKVTEEEMQGVPHHMIGIVDRKDKFDVVHFRNQALPIVQRILDDGKIPFIVGGTNYYIESLLWEVLIAENRQRRKSAEQEGGREQGTNSGARITSSDTNLLFENPILHLFHSKNGKVEENDLKDLTNQGLHLALRIVDPDRADRLHPNDRRKVLRSLQVRFQTGRKHSELIAEQCVPLTTEQDEETKVTPTALNSNRALGGTLRFPKSLCLWIQVDDGILKERITNRTENMVKVGLRQELDSYMDLLRKENSILNYEEGILQSIGFKEFHSYLQLLPDGRNTEEGDKRFQEGVERLTIVTKQYAKRQLKWVNQRFTVSGRREVPPVYKVNGNEVDDKNWLSNVFSPADGIIEACLANKLDEDRFKERLVVKSLELNEDVVARTCETCDNRVFIGKLQWQSHIKSSKHRKMLKRKAKLASTSEKNAEDNKHPKLDTEDASFGAKVASNS